MSAQWCGNDESGACTVLNCCGGCATVQVLSVCLEALRRVKNVLKTCRRRVRVCCAYCTRVTRLPARLEGSERVPALVGCCWVAQPT